MFIDVKPLIGIIDKEIEELRKEIFSSPKLISVCSSPDDSTLYYFKSQERLCKKYGIAYDVVDTKFPLRTISELSADPDVHGIFLAFPMPKEYDEYELCRSVNPLKDVDGVNPINLGNIFYGKEDFAPCTAQACVRIIIDNISPKSKKIAVIGRSNQVGKPVGLMLQRYGVDATVVCLNSYTLNLKEITSEQDAVVVAIGKKHFLKGDFVKQGALIVDVGINEYEGKVYGDADPSVAENAQLTPVPNGVGSVTSKILIKNVFKAYTLIKK